MLVTAFSISPIRFKAYSFAYRFIPMVPLPAHMRLSHVSDSATTLSLTRPATHTSLKILATLWKKVTPEGVVKGSTNSTLLARDMAAAFGRTPLDQSILYVVTNGGNCSSC